MANDDTYTVTNEWTAVEANGADIETGTFSVISYGHDSVGFIKSDTIPTTENGVYYFIDQWSTAKYALAGTEKLYAKSRLPSTIIGVVPA